MWLIRQPHGKCRARGRQIDHIIVSSALAAAAQVANERFLQSDHYAVHTSLGMEKY